MPTPTYAAAAITTASTVSRSSTGGVGAAAAACVVPAPILIPIHGRCLDSLAPQEMSEGRRACVVREAVGWQLLHGLVKVETLGREGVRGGAP